MKINLAQQIEKTAHCPKKKAENFFDGNESAVQFRQFFADHSSATEKLQNLTAVAQQVASEPCQIHSQIQAQDTGVWLEAEFQFCCQAEAVIFQMKLR